MSQTMCSGDLFEGFTETRFCHAGVTRQVYRLGSGPAVVLMHEVPGLHEGVVRLARRLAGAGMSIWLPVLFGTPGVKVSAASIASCMGKVCISREFKVLASRRSSPVTHWLRALSREAHQACGGPGVGVIGMCLTGGFGLAMMADSSVIAPVLANPSLPFALSADKAGALGLEPEALDAIARRASEQDITVLGLRFTADLAVPDARFEHLRHVFGSRFETFEIDSAAGNPQGISRWAHSVLGVSYVDQPDHPTFLAQERMVAFLQARLEVGSLGACTWKP